MTEIIITLDDDSNVSFIRNAIELIKGVRNTIVRTTDSQSGKSQADRRLKVFNKLAGSVLPSEIDTNDERTRYLLSK